MIMADLKTNYVDDVLDTTKNQLRKYQQIQNDDGTVSFVDVTKYTQVGTSFGAKDINDTNAAINDVNGKLNKFVTEKVELGSDVILNKSSNFTITFNVTKTGYIPIVVCSWALYNRDDAQYTHVNGIEVGTGINTGYVYIQGRYSNSSATGRIPANAYVGVLYQAQ